MHNRDQILFNFYRLQRAAGYGAVEACEDMMDFSKRFDRAAAQVADDAFNRDLAIIKAVMERK